jgi:hypothetical protein
MRAPRNPENPANIVQIIMAITPTINDGIKAPRSMMLSELF